MCDLVSGCLLFSTVCEGIIIVPSLGHRCCYSVNGIFHFADQDDMSSLGITCSGDHFECYCVFNHYEHSFCFVLGVSKKYIWKILVRHGRSFFLTGLVHLTSCSFSLIAYVPHGNPCIILFQITRLFLKSGNYPASMWKS